MSVESCPSSPNCVSTAAATDDTVHYMAPVSYSADAAEAIAAIEKAIIDAGGTISESSALGVDATFRTALLRFTDDVSFRLDEDAKVLHFRSASRVGHSDLGANRKRLGELLAPIAAAIT